VASCNAVLAHADPSLAPIAAQDNSPDTYPTVVPLTLSGQTGDVVWTITTSDPRVADAAVDPTAPAVLLSPQALGSATVTVTATDAVSSASTSFSYSVRSQSSVRTLVASAPQSQAILLQNTSQTTVSLWLDVNGRLYPGSIARIADNIRAMPDESPGETFEHKAWRSLSMNTWRGFTLTDAEWIHDPTVLVNSLGFEYCDDVAAALAVLVRSAGGTARVWTLNGHVVPEVLIGGRWRLYDADQGVIYHDTDGSEVGLAELVANPSLVTSPPVIEQINKLGGANPYSEEVAEIFSSSGDNELLDTNEGDIGFSYMQLTVPPGGQMLLGGKWSTGIVDGVTGSDIHVRAEAQLTIPAGWTGELPSALVLIDASGSGQLDIEGAKYEIGSADLEARLRNFEISQRWKSVTRADGPIVLTFLYSAVAARLLATNELTLTGFNTGAITTQLVSLPSDNQLEPPP